MSTCTHSLTTEYEPAPSVFPTLYRHGWTLGFCWLCDCPGRAVSVAAVMIAQSRREPRAPVGAENYIVSRTNLGDVAGLKAALKVVAILNKTSFR